jgi:aerobic-type carbon monoxide dehydrogenase small subunit (CoxS/CutS family)
MAKPVTIMVNGRPIAVAEGTLLAAALAHAGVTGFRRGVQGEPRGPVCGMGICFECRVTLNGQPHCRTCLTLCEEGMEVQTDG